MPVEVRQGRAGAVNYRVVEAVVELLSEDFIAKGALTGCQAAFVAVEVHVAQARGVEHTGQVSGDFSLKLEVRKEDLVGVVHEFAGGGSPRVLAGCGAIGSALAVQQLPRRVGRDRSVPDQFLADHHGLQLVAQAIGEVFRRGNRDRGGCGIDRFGQGALTGFGQARVGLWSDVRILSLDEVRQRVGSKSNPRRLGFVGAGLESSNASGKELWIGFEVSPALEGVLMVQAHEIGLLHVAQHLVDGGF